MALRRTQTWDALAAPADTHDDERGGTFGPAQRDTRTTAHHLARALRRAAALLAILAASAMTLFWAGLTPTG